MTASQRDKLAKQGVMAALGVTNEKAAVTAALEAVYERLASDMDLCQSVRQKYQEIAALAPAARQKADVGPVPVPIHSGNPDQYTPYGKFDPYQLISEYGAHQLRTVLIRGTQRDLREATDIVQAREQGTKPASRSKKDDMIDYIVEHVAGPGY